MFASSGMIGFRGRNDRRFMKGSALWRSRRIDLFMQPRSLGTNEGWWLPVWLHGDITYDDGHNAEQLSGPGYW